VSGSPLRWRIGPRDWGPFGRRLRAVWPDDRGLVVYLEGPLGAGKTSLVRGLVRAWMPGVEVTSPSFILREDYGGEGGPLFVHVDLYRLRSPAEVEDLALRELPKGASLLVEWPGHGRGRLPAADLVFVLRPVENARILEAEVLSPVGEGVLAALAKDPWLAARTAVVDVR
jgi:tRNA threonylcarbamoyladenosine biosynthesis protein TsaE